MDEREEGAVMRIKKLPTVLRTAVTFGMCPICREVDVPVESSAGLHHTVTHYTLNSAYAVSSEDETCRGSGMSAQPHGLRTVTFDEAVKQGLVSPEPRVYVDTKPKPSRVEVAIDSADLTRVNADNAPADF